MRKAVFLAATRTDLVEIQTYIARQSGSRVIARRFVEKLRRRCHELAALPGIVGRARPELGADIRSSTYNGYVIFFRYVNERLEVIDILEGHRDIDTFFNPNG